jgi:single-strand selective monofunctional uracil DNA glycosylase
VTSPARRFTTAPSQSLITAARRLARAVSGIEFGAPVVCVYNPLIYAWTGHAAYLRKFARTPKRVVFLGMNPGPFGMVQTGVPFGEINAVRNWLGIETAIGRPARQHPRRPVLGFSCPRCEISGQRLWGLFASRFGTAEAFFQEHIVINYCPLAWMESSGRNLTPDKLRVAERTRLFVACDEHLATVVAALRPEWVIGVGDFALQRAKAALKNESLKIGRVLHPSPASPAANRNWADLAAAQLELLGVWRGGAAITGVGTASSPISPVFLRPPEDGPSPPRRP